jgi:hypothetical protein
MKIVEHTPERLRLRHFGSHAGSCLLDRKHDLAVVTRLAFVIPYAQTRLPLSSVDDVVVKRRSHRKIYHLLLSLKRGRSLTIGASAKDEAMQAADGIRVFLKASS